jgi:Cdc6-like AAA superfamily ATPase
MTTEECLRDLKDMIHNVEAVAADLGLDKVHDPVFFDSCRDGKFSYHVHFPSYYFANQDIALYFAKKVNTRLHDAGHTLKLDPAVYSRNRCWRTAFSCKMGKPESTKRWCQGKERPSLDQVDAVTFGKLLVQTKWDGIETVTTLPGYSPGNRYNAKASQVEMKEKVESKKKKGAKVMQEEKLDEGRYINALQAFYEEHDLIWDRGLVHSLESRDDDTVVIRIKPGGRATQCLAGETHESNCIMYILGTYTVRVLRSYCFGCSRNVYKTKDVSSRSTQLHGFGDCALVEDFTDRFAVHRGGHFVDEGGTRQFHTEEHITTMFETACEKGGRLKESTIFLTGSMGTGKTTAVAKVLDMIVKENPDVRILANTSRCALASELSRAFAKAGLSFCDYRKVKTEEDTKRLVIQVESMRKLISKNLEGGLLAPRYDVLIVDELAAHLKQFLSSTVGDSETTFSYFMDLLKTARVVIIMCADSPEGSWAYEFVKRIRSSSSKGLERFFKRDSTRTIHVVSPAAGLRIWLDEPEGVYVAAYEALFKREANVWCSSNSRRMAIKLQQLVFKWARAKRRPDIYNGVLILSGRREDISDGAKSAVLDDRTLTTHVPVVIMDDTGELIANKDSKEFPVRLFVFTPAITHGFSFDDEGGHFTVHLGIFRQGPIPARDALQQLKRHRRARDVLVGIEGSATKPGKDFDEEVEATVRNQEIISGGGELELELEDEDEDEDPWVSPSNPRALPVDRAALRELLPSTLGHLREIRTAYEKESRLSAIDFLGEFLKVASQQGVHAVYEVVRSNNFAQRRSKALLNLLRWEQLAELSQSAAAEDPLDAGGNAAVTLLGRARKTTRETLSMVGRPKTIAATELLQPLVSLLKKRTSPVLLTMLELVGGDVTDLHTVCRGRTLNQELVHSWEDYEATFRSMHREKPKRIRKLHKGDVRKKYDKDKEAAWCALFNEWFKQKLRLLRDEEATRPQCGGARRRLGFPLHAGLFRTVLTWAAQSDDGYVLSEDFMPDLCAKQIARARAELQRLHREKETKEKGKETKEEGEVPRGATLISRETYKEGRARAGLDFANRFVSAP